MSALKFLNFGLTFGLTTAIVIYVGYRGGQYLDRRFGTEPWLMTAGILLAAAAAFKHLLAEVQRIDQEIKRDKERQARERKRE